MKKTYRVVFENSWSAAQRITKIVTTSDIEKSIGRIRKLLVEQIAPVNPITARDLRLLGSRGYITLISVELLGKATIHA